MSKCQASVAKKQRHNFPSPTPSKTMARFDDSKVGSTMAKWVQWHPSRFQDDEADLTTTKQIRQWWRRFDGGFEADSMMTKRIQWIWSGYHHNDADSTITIWIPQQRHQLTNVHDHTRAITHSPTHWTIHRETDAPSPPSSSLWLALLTPLLALMQWWLSCPRCLTSTPSSSKTNNLELILANAFKSKFQVVDTVAGYKVSDLFRISAHLLTTPPSF